MAWEDPAVVVVSGAKSASGNSGAVNSPKGLYLNVLLEVTAQSGTTPTLDVSVEWSMDGTNFGVAQPADSFTQVTTTVPTRVVKAFQNKAPFYRVVYTLGGTSPNYTFQVTRYAVGA
jgi:hypothetical protein